MANNSGSSRLLLAVLCLSLLFAASCGAGGVSEPPNNNAHINGSWNVELTTGPVGSAPNITFALVITQTGAVVDGTIIPYTGSTPATTNCLVFTGLTAHGNVGVNSVSLAITDPQSSSTITINGTVNSAINSIDGTFATTFGAANGNAPCANINGTAALRKQ